MMAVRGHFTCPACRGRCLPVFKRRCLRTRPESNILLIITALPMTLFEGASEFVIHGGQFSHVTYQLPHDSSQIVRRLVEKDRSLNQYSVEDGTVTLPHFSKSLLLQDLQVDPDVGRMNAGSCSFDLMVRLGLFPGQQNEALAEYDTKVPLDTIVSRGNCYCARISRHGFVFLVSKYFQHVSVAESTTGGKCFVLSTTIGRFKCYEIDDRTFIHFDSGTRSSDVDLVKDQTLDDILRTSKGEFQIYSSSGASVLYDEADQVTEWHRSTVERLESVASAQFCGVPNAVIYMTKSTLQKWMRFKEFASAMLNNVLSVIDGLKEPAEFVSAMRNFSPINVKTALDAIKGTPVENLASSIFVYRTLSRKHIGEMPHKEFHNLSTMFLLNMLMAHRYFRQSPRVDMTKLVKTSVERFVKILDAFPTLDGLSSAGRLSEDHIQKELFALLETNKNNVALVAIQGYFALLLKWNASRILMNAREAPEEWIRFVGADDDDLFIG